MPEPDDWSTDSLAPTLVERIPDAIVVADREGTIRFWNAGAARLFGHAAADAVGRSLDLIIPEKHRRAHWTGWRRMLETGTSRYGADDLLAVPGLRHDGTRVSLEFSIFAVHDTGDTVAGIGAVMRDVTRRFEETKALKRRLAAYEGDGGGTS